MPEPVAEVELQLHSWDAANPRVVFRRIEVLHGPQGSQGDPTSLALRLVAQACNEEAEHHEAVQRKVETEAAPGGWSMFTSISRETRVDEDDGAHG